MARFILIIIFIPFFCSSFQDDELRSNNSSLFTILTEKQKQHVKTFIDCIKKDNVDLLKTLVEYPLRRGYPLERITSQEEFKSKYNEIFDLSLKAEIINSNIELDWGVFESREILLKSGGVKLSNEGKLKFLIPSDIEDEKRNRLKREDTDTLHKSIQNTKYPILHMTTSKSIIRVYITDYKKCTLVVWGKDLSLSSKPKLLIENGLIFLPVNGGVNCSFYNDPYKYEIFIDRDGKYHGKPVEFVTYKNDKVISREPAIELLD